MSGSLQSPMSSEYLNSNPIEMNVLTEELCSRDEPGDELISDVRPTLTPSIYHLVPDIEIKQEEVDVYRDSTADSEDSSHLDLDTVPSIPLYVDCDSANLNDFYSKDLSHCEENCETCQKYRKILMKHVRSTHDPPQPTHDPLHIDSLNVDHDLPQGDLSSLIQIKCEVDENINRKDCSKELDFQFNPTSDDSDRIDETGMEIKREDPGFHNSTTTSTIASDSENDCDRDFELVLNIPYVDCNSIKVEENDLDLLRCEPGCQTCENYMRMLSEHVRSAHAPRQPIQDPLHIDPLKIDPDSHLAEPSSSMQVKTEVEEDIEKMECCEEDTRQKPFKCAVCKKSFTILSLLKIHNIVHTGERPFKCDECEKSYTRLAYLTAHKTNHTGEKPFNCDECENSFASPSHLTRHKRTHTGERPYVCEVCGKRFTENGTLTTHKRHHTGEKPHKCTVCMKSFTTLSVLTVHSKVHTGDRPFKCDECEKSYTRLVHLTDHKKNHSGGKPFNCIVCGKSFATMSILNVHSKLHTREKPFNCDECEKSFASPSHLTRHKRTHTGERPYVCEVCGKRFTENGTLTTHKRHHTGEKPHKCTVCMKSFTTLSVLTVHSKVHTGDRPFKCDECEKSYTRLVHLTTHKRVHTAEKS